jgi:hypothetical protein
MCMNDELAARKGEARCMERIRRVELRSGQSYPHGKRANSIRIAPQRDGKQVANLWRIWAQGDELYLATRNTGKEMKVSLHSSGRWAMEGWNYKFDFGPPTQLSVAGWVHAIRLNFLVGNNPAEPINAHPIKKSKPAILVETPVGHRLLLDVLLGPSGTTAESHLPAEMNGQRLLNLILRNGSQIVVVARVGPMLPPELIRLTEVRKDLRTQMSYMPKPGKAHGEYIELLSNVNGSGNVILIIPLGMDTFVVDESKKAQQ